MKKKNVFYAQSGGVTAVINASACGVIETARKNKSKLGKVYAGVNGILGALTEDMIDTTAESAKTIAAIALHAGRRVRLGALQAQGPRPEPRRVRALDRGLQSARHRLLLLQRRRRLDGHRAQGVADRRAARLSRRLRRRAQDRRQRSTGHRHVPRLRLGREIRRGVDARSRARRRVDGAHVDARVRARGHGPARGLDRGRRRARRREGRRRAARDPVPGDPVRRSRVPRAREGQRREATSTASSSCPRARTTPTAGSCPRPAARTRSATRSSAASRQRSRSSCASKLGFKYHYAIADYLQRAARHIASKVDVAQAYAMGKAAVELALSGRERGDADDRAQVRQAVPLEGRQRAARERREQREDDAAQLHQHDGFAITAACRKYLAPLIAGRGLPALQERAAELCQPT